MLVQGLAQDRGSVYLVQLFTEPVRDMVITSQEADKRASMEVPCDFNQISQLVSIESATCGYNHRVLLALDQFMGEVWGFCLTRPNRDEFKEMGAQRKSSSVPAG